MGEISSDECKRELDLIKIILEKKYKIDKDKLDEEFSTLYKKYEACKRNPENGKSLQDIIYDARRMYKNLKEKTPKNEIEDKNTKKYEETCKTIFKLKNELKSKRFASEGLAEEVFSKAEDDLAVGMDIINKYGRELDFSLAMDKIEMKGIIDFKKALDFEKCLTELYDKKGRRDFNEAKYYEDDRETVLKNLDTEIKTIENEIRKKCTGAKWHEEYKKKAGINDIEYKQPTKKEQNKIEENNEENLPIEQPKENLLQKMWKNMKKLGNSAINMLPKKNKESDDLENAASDETIIEEVENKTTVGTKIKGILNKVKGIFSKNKEEVENTEEMENTDASSFVPKATVNEEKAIKAAEKIASEKATEKTTDKGEK